jgi:hypothetical protein
LPLLGDAWFPKQCLLGCMKDGCADMELQLQMPGERCMQNALRFCTLWWVPQWDELDIAED